LLGLKAAAMHKENIKTIGELNKSAQKKIKKK